MARAERPLDPNADPLHAFAAQLRRLREGAGRPTYAALARRGHRSPSALSEAAGGRKFPSLETTLAYVRALDGDESTWAARWRETARLLGGDHLDRDPAAVASDHSGAPDPSGEQATLTTADAGPVREPGAGKDGRGTFRMPLRTTVLAAAAVLASIATVAAWRIAAGGGAAAPGDSGRTGRGSPAYAVAASQPAVVRDGADPKDAGCGADPALATLETRPMTVDDRVVGAVELRYSPMCGVSWPRFVPTPLPATLPPSRVYLAVVDGTDPARSASFDLEYTGISVYGNVLNSTRSCVRAEAYLIGTGWRSPSARTACYRGASLVGATASGSG